MAKKSTTPDLKKPNGREGLPLAASDIEQGPYKVESSHSVYDRFQVRRVKDGKPIGTIGERGSVQALCDELNAAYLAGTKASTSEGDPRRSKMVEAESLRLLEECRDAMVSNDVHGWAFNLTDHIELLRRRLGGEDGGGPLSGDGDGGDLGASAETADRVPTGSLSLGSATPEPSKND